MKTIVVTRRSDDYHACLEGEPAFWGCGTTPSEAIGDLVRSHEEKLGIATRFDFPKS